MRRKKDMSGNDNKYNYDAGKYIKSHMQNTNLIIMQ